MTANTKLWVDDERPAPDATWDVALNSAQANETFDASRHRVVSLDYSLGTFGDTGEMVIDHWAATQRWPAEVRLHSGSASARRLLAQIIADHFPEGGGPVVVDAP